MAACRDVVQHLPQGVDPHRTLATQFWAYESNVSYYQAAIYAGVMILIAAVPGYVLGRWFDRQPARIGRRRPERARPHRPHWCPHEGPSHLGRGQGGLGPQPVLRGVDL